MTIIKRHKWLTSVMVGVAVVTTLLVVLFPVGMTINGKGTLSLGIGSVSVLAYPSNWYEDSQLHNGLWYQDINNPIYIQDTPQSPIYLVSFMKIYSLGGTTRVMELSTYPRAYVDKSPHVYTVDTPFTVTQHDLNDYYNNETAIHPRPEIPDGTNVYRDTRGYYFLLGETAVHYAGDPLPGSFPMWIESQFLPTPKWVDSKSTVFPAVFQAVKGQLVQVVLHEAYYRQDTDTTWTKMPDNYWNQFVATFTGTDTNVKINVKIGKDRLIVRVLYDRVF